MRASDLGATVLPLRILSIPLTGKSGTMSKPCLTKSPFMRQSDEALSSVHLVNGSNQVEVLMTNSEVLVAIRSTPPLNVRTGQ